MLASSGIVSVAIPAKHWKNRFGEGGDYLGSSLVFTPVAALINGSLIKTSKSQLQ